MNDADLAWGTATLNLQTLLEYVESEESGSFVTFEEIHGNNDRFVDGEVLYVVGDDLVWGPDVETYMAGDILVQGAESGAFGRISLSVSKATADEMVVDEVLPYSDGWADVWPEDGVSASITSSAFTARYDVDEGEEATETTLFRLLLGEDESSYNLWDKKYLDYAWGLWGTSGSTNIAWTVVDGTELFALEDFNSGAVQDVTVTEINKSPATSSKDLEVSWTGLPCTTCYKVWVNGEIYDEVNLTAANTGTITRTFEGFNYATEYDVQVQACVDGLLQSRLSAVDDVTTECYLLAPVPLVPNNGMQDASIAPSFVWDMPIDGCDPISYDFQLATDPGFNNIVVSTNVTGAMGYTYTARDLDYDTNHYWRVRSVYGSLKSAWSPVQNFHTMLEPQPPVDVTVTQAPDVNLTVPPVVTVPPAQTITVSVPPAVTLTQTVTSVETPTITMPDQPTPAYIWVIVAVGAILTIAVIVLIIRTRRAE
jgi:hypothetical protein